MGEVRVDGTQICELSDDARARLRLERMGFVFQQMNMLSNLNIIDNIILPAIQSEKVKKKNKKSEEELKEKAKTLMDKTGIYNLRDSRNDGGFSRITNARRDKTRVHDRFAHTFKWDCGGSDC